MNQMETVPLEKGGLRWQCLSATAIKGIAVALMFLDHIHQMYAAAGAPVWLTMAGRLVFPMFLFAAAESFHYTRSKKKYLQHLLFASWGMTAFTFLLQKALPNASIVLMNNAFSTLFVAGLYMLFWDWFLEGLQTKRPKQVLKAILCCFIPILCALPLYCIALLSFNEDIPTVAIRILAVLSLLLPNILTVEGGFALVVLGVLFYILRAHRVLQILVLLLLSGLVYFTGGGFQCLMGLAALPIALYNGTRGHGRKNFFYWFYPAHIAALYLLATLLTPLVP